MKEETTHTQAFYIGDFTVLPMQNEVIINGHSVQVENKVMQVLVYLAQNSDRVVTREELLQEIWKQEYVSEEVLTRCISVLRRTFKDDIKEPRVIRTIRKKGYRLVAEVTFGDKREKAQEVVEKKKNSLVFILVISVLILLFIGNTIYSQRDNNDFVVWQDFPTATSKKNEIFPAISPDGSRIAYAMYSDSDTNRDITVAISGVEGESIRITNHPGNESAPVWSPDGRYIAYFRQEGEKSGIYKIPAQGGMEEKIGVPYNLIAQHMSWSPDGKQIAYVDRESKRDSYSIYLMNVENGTKVKLTTPTNQHWGDYAPSFSPDGSKLSFIRGISAGTHDIFIHDLKTGDERRLTHDTQRTLGQVWAEDDRIIYSASRGSSAELWSVSKKGGKPTWLNIAGRFPSVDKSGELLVTEVWDHDYDIISVDVSNRSEAVFNREVVSGLNSTLEDFSPQISKDGTKLVFVSNRSGNFELYIYDKTNRQTKRVTDINSKYVSSPHWSSDDSQLLFNVFTLKGNADIYHLDIEKQQLKQVTSSISNEITPQWAPGDKGFYFSSNQTEKWEVWYHNLEDDSQKQITQNGGYSVKAPSNENIYFTKFDSTGIWEKSLINGVEERIIEDLHLFDWGNFVVSEKGIYYISRLSASANPALKFYDFESLETELVLNLNNIPNVAGMSLSGEERRILITQRVSNNSDVILYRNLSTDRRL
ncbi:MAG: hypothetical protein ED557_13870 [Balneola sp.]|nr:MAG: hypothetical protein ED557_13870 [Balneola sp.]